MDILTICGLVTVAVLMLVIVWCRKELRADISKRLDQNPRGVVLKAVIKSKLAKKEQQGVSRTKAKAMRILSAVFLASLVLALVTHFVANEISIFFWTVALLSGVILIALDRLHSFIVKRGEARG